MKITNIAIDGPAGAGKSTIAKKISQALNIIYLDTGAMYRAVALKAIHSDIDTKDKDRLEKMVKNIDIKIKFLNGHQIILLDQRDVSAEIRTSKVSMGASNVAVNQAVRLKMVELQRDIARNNSVVMDGRDIGSFVLPHADLKIFLTASVEERAKRRYNELMAKGEKNIAYEDVKKDIEIRDRQDSTRSFAPLIKAEDAVEVDTTLYTIDEVVEKVMEMVKKL